jgi:ABC-type phosphate/phosphonate transport system ATPase subunit
MKSRRKITKNFTFGNVVAEADDLLASSYFDNGDYNAVSSRTVRRCFVIGRTDSGKSALIRHLESELPDHVVRIHPDSLAISYIDSLAVVHRLMDLGVHMESFFKVLWKRVILIEVLKHRFPTHSQQERTNI